VNTGRGEGVHRSAATGEAARTGDGREERAAFGRQPPGVDGRFGAEAAPQVDGIVARQEPGPGDEPDLPGGDQLADARSRNAGGAGHLISREDLRQHTS
jgi:hypothetical protein